MGPIISETAYAAYQRYIDEIDAGNIVSGGETLGIGNGYFVAPTVVKDLPDDHRLWQHEMFAPIVTVRGVDSPDEAMRLANDVALGLTAGMYSEDPDEIEWFLDNIEAGVLYVNRATGATTGAWPGYQSFGGWKGSTGSGKASCRPILPAAIHARAVAYDHRQLTPSTPHKSVGATRWLAHLTIIINCRGDPLGRRYNARYNCEFTSPPIKSPLPEASGTVQGWG